MNHKYFRSLILIISTIIISGCGYIKEKALQEAIDEAQAAKNAAREAKRHARKMEKMEQERLMLQKQQLYQTQQPQYAPAIKTECKRNYLGQPECISYDSRDHFAPYR